MSVGHRRHTIETQRLLKSTAGWNLCTLRRERRSRLRPHADTGHKRPLVPLGLERRACLKIAATQSMARPEHNRRPSSALSNIAGLVRWTMARPTNDPPTTDIPIISGKSHAHGLQRGVDYRQECTCDPLRLRERGGDVLRARLTQPLWMTGLNM